MNDDSPLVIEPPEPATASVIWLHGLGADGHDFEPIVAEFGDSVTRNVRYLFPHAPRIPVTINGGAVMRAWYDITDADLSNRADEAGVRASAEILEALIEQGTGHRPALDTHPAGGILPGWGHRPAHGTALSPTPGRDFGPVHLSSLAGIGG